MKKFIIITLMVLLTISFQNQIYAANQNSKQLEKAYNEVVLYSSQYGIEFELEFEDFVIMYESNGMALNDFVDSMKLIIDSEVTLYYEVEDIDTLTMYSSSSSSGESIDWQRNTGESLPQEANYDSCYLLINARPGDIIYEGNGGLGITGHIVVVEGKFYSPEWGQYYIRVIEAINDGVVRSIVDCDRVVAQAGELYHVNGVTVSDVDDIVDFLISQLGKSFSLDFAKDCSTSESDWYCSELAWCAYYREGVDIERNINGFRGEPGVTPRDIKYDDNLSKKVLFPLPSGC